MGFKNFLREYFTFNRRQRNGVFVLLSIILIFILYLSFSDRFFPPEKTDFSKFEKDIAQFEAAQKQSSDSDSSETKNYFTSSPEGVLRTNSPIEESAERFHFNPNNLPEEDWKRLGLSDKQIKVIKNYESKGGKFRSNEDVKKMYCIPAKLYSSLEAFIQIPADTTRRYAQTPFSSRRRVGDEVIELNSADTTALISLKGIGSSYARRIIKYRDLLGGFIKKEQLLEVYALDKERYDGLSENVTVDASKIKTLDINTVTLDELKKHPYIKYNIANLIVNYRKQHGNYKTVEDIKKLNLMNDTLFAKIAPYLTVK